MKPEVVDRWLASAATSQRVRVFDAAARAVHHWTEVIPSTRAQVSRAVAAALEVAVIAEVWRIHAGQDGSDGVGS